MARVTTSSVAAAPLGAVVAWAWNGLYPEYPMPAEVAAAVSPIVGAVFAWLVGWAPSPHGDPTPDQKEKETTHEKTA